MSSRSSRSAALLLTAVLALTASGCGGDDDPGTAKPKPAQSSLTGPGVEPEVNFATADEFFAAIAEATPSSLAAAQELAAPGSGAARYVTYLAGLSAKGTATAGGTVKQVSPGRYRICAPAGGSCSSIARVLLTDGKVSSFTIDGKRAGAKK